MHLNLCANPLGRLGLANEFKGEGYETYVHNYAFRRTRLHGCHRQPLLPSGFNSPMTDSEKGYFQNLSLTGGPSGRGPVRFALILSAPGALFRMITALDRSPYLKRTVPSAVRRHHGSEATHGVVPG